MAREKRQDRTDSKSRRGGRDHPGYFTAREMRKGSAGDAEERHARRFQERNAPKLKQVNVSRAEMRDSAVDPQARKISPLTNERSSEADRGGHMKGKRPLEVVLPCAPSANGKGRHPVGRTDPE